MKAFKRLLGLMITLVSIIGIIVGIAGAIAVPQVIKIIENSTSGVLDGVVAGFDSATETVVIVRNTIEESSLGLETVETSAVDVASLIQGTEPVIGEVSLMLSEQVPDTVETIQKTLPNLIEVADTVDEALQSLSQFSIDEELALPPLNLGTIDLGLAGSFDLGTIPLPAVPLPGVTLGIDYNPETGFDDSLVGITDDLEGVPESMRALSAGLDNTTQDLLTIAKDVEDISENINAINAQVSLLPGQIDTYLLALDDVKANLNGVEDSINGQLNTVRIGLVVVFIWFAMIQIAPLYIGTALLLGRKID